MRIDSEVWTILDFLIETVPGNKLPAADGIFVFGHVDKRVPEHAAKLFLSGKANKVIISGGARESNPIPKGFSSEAEYYASVMNRSGVPDDSFILEYKASNTLENVLFGMQASREAGFFPRSLILVALPPLLRRSKATFTKQFPNIRTFGSAFPIGEGDWQDRNRVRRILAEIDRLKQYSQSGDIAEVHIPRHVLNIHKAISHLI